MNEKLTLQDLIDILAKKAKITKKEADAFFRELFAIISENIFENDIVKIKDFGVFKLTLVNRRESVNVNTGNKIEIPAHYKLSFIPDKTLKELVNKPFALFETVLLEDNVTFSSSATEEESEPDGDEEEITDSADLLEATDVVEPKEPLVEVPVKVSAEKPALAKPVEPVSVKAESIPIKEDKKQQNTRKQNAFAYVYTYSNQETESNSTTITLPLASSEASRFQTAEQSTIKESEPEVEEVKNEELVEELPLPQLPNVPLEEEDEISEEISEEIIESEEDEIADESSEDLSIEDLDEEIDDVSDDDELSEDEEISFEDLSVTPPLISVNKEETEEIIIEHEKVKFQPEPIAPDLSETRNIVPDYEDLDLESDEGYNTNDLDFVDAIDADEKGKGKKVKEKEEHIPDYYVRNDSISAKLLRKVPLALFIIIALGVIVYSFNSLFNVEYGYEPYLGKKTLTVTDSFPYLTQGITPPLADLDSAVAETAKRIDSLNKVKKLQLQDVPPPTLANKPSVDTSFDPLFNKDGLKIGTLEKARAKYQADLTKQEATKDVTGSASPSAQVIEVLRAGSSLQSIAAKHYGKSVFWVYIYLENKDVIKSPDNVELGMKLKIPEAAKYNIDAKNAVSLENAKLLESRIIREAREKRFNTNQN